jgi:mannose-6-phosphate isomerase-like protein (cupin superfamily)
MEIYRRVDGFLRCDHTVGSPVEVIFPPHLWAVPSSEAYHYHRYHEYYVILAGRGRLLVEGAEVPMEAETVVMVAPGERHRVTWVDPDQGIRWIVIKQQSGPDGKFIVPEPDTAEKQAR